jgi:hypothetical protein
MVDRYHPSEDANGPLLRGIAKGPTVWILSTVASVALAGALGAHALLWSYDVRISRIEDRQAASAQAFDDLKLELRTMRGRLDQILDELRRRP